MTKKEAVIPLVAPEAYERHWRKVVGDSDTSDGAVPWDKLDAAVVGDGPPSGSFSLQEIKERYKLPDIKATKALVRRLVTSGKIKFVGRFGNLYCYQMVKQ